MTALCQEEGRKLNIGFDLLILNLCYQFIIKVTLPKNIIRMSHQGTVNPAAPDKKQVRREIGEKLAGALAEYKQELGEKKLATRVREVSKLISRDLRKSSKKHKKIEKRSTVKVPKKAGKSAAAEKQQ